MPAKVTRHDGVGLAGVLDSEDLSSVVFSAEVCVREAVSVDDAPFDELALSWVPVDPEAERFGVDTDALVPVLVFALSPFASSDSDDDSDALVVIGINDDAFSSEPDRAD